MELLQPVEDYSAKYIVYAKKEGVSTSTQIRRGKRLNPGFVRSIAADSAAASLLSLSDLELAAKDREAKGVIWYRGASKLAQEIEEWVSQQEEDDDCCSFAKEVIQLSHPSGLSSPKKRRKRTTSNTLSADVNTACHRLVQRLPKGLFRESVLTDALALTESITNMCPGVPFLMLQLEVIGHNRCSRWHQDQYAGRMIITYTGPSTWMVNDKDVNFGMFEDCFGVPFELSDPLIVPDYASIHKPPSNAVVLIKGNEWPGIEQSANKSGVVHKSPNMRLDLDGNPICKRLALKVDLSYRSSF
jgi:hypothetical protein